MQGLSVLVIEGGGEEVRVLTSPDARCEPSGENASAFTAPLFPSSVAFSASALPSHEYR